MYFFHWLAYFFLASTQGKMYINFVSVYADTPTAKVTTIKIARVDHVYKKLFLSNNNTLE